MAIHELKVSLSTPRLFAVAFCLGICVGAPLGIVALQLGGKVEQGGFGLLADDETVCVNGVAYAPHKGDLGSPWNGIYRPIQKAQPALIGEDGQEILQQVIPTPCKITRG